MRFVRRHNERQVVVQNRSNVSTIYLSFGVSSVVLLYVVSRRRHVESIQSRLIFVLTPTKIRFFFPQTEYEILKRLVAVALSWVAVVKVH